MKYAYAGYNKNGKEVRGVIEASSAEEATERLYQDGVYTTALEANADDATRGRTYTPGQGRGKPRDLAGLTRQLAILIKTGTPLVPSLAAVERQCKPGPWRAVIGDVRRRVEEGDTIASAMEHFPKFFDPVYRALIAAGEQGGRLGAMLDRLSSMTRQQVKIRSAISGALVYPILLIALSVAVIVVMLTTVLPRFTGLFATLDAPIPASTVLLMRLSAVLTGYWPWLVGSAIGLGVGGFFWCRSDAGRAAFGRIALRLPIAGRIVRSIIVARIARILGVLLQSKVPMLDALKLTKQAAKNDRYARLLDRVEDAVTHGETMSSALKSSDLIPSSMYEAVVTGERTGEIGTVLVSLADFMDEDNEVLIKSLTTILEPLILIVLGAVVGFVTISMFMPLFDLTSVTQAS